MWPEDDAGLALGSSITHPPADLRRECRPRRWAAPAKPEGRIELRNFGVFAVKKRKPRKARNPRTGRPVKVPARLVVTFKPGREMEERIRQSRNVSKGRD
jgi:hypothetical protein